jgi:lambda family phage portal protein
VHLGAFEEAAVIAARVGASQMGFIQSPDGGETLSFDGTDDKGNPQIEAEPATFPILPPGYEMSGWNPKYPDAAIEPFVKAMLRGVAAGLGVAYHNLANDPSEVNYSTAKVFGGDEHEMWRGLQEFVIDHHEYPLHRDWTKMQVLMGTLPFAADRLDKYCEVEWQARRWASPDPLKDAKADVELINNKLVSRTRVIAARGEDIEDIFDELAHEAEMADAKGIDLAPPAKPAPGEGKPEGETDEEEPDSGNAKT